MHSLKMVHTSMLTHTHAFTNTHTHPHAYTNRTHAYTNRTHPHTHTHTYTHAHTFVIGSKHAQTRAAALGTHTATVPTAHLTAESTTTPHAAAAASHSAPLRPLQPQASASKRRRRPNSQLGTVRVAQAVASTPATAHTTGAMRAHSSALLLTAHWKHNRCKRLCISCGGVWTGGMAHTQSTRVYAEGEKEEEEALSLTSITSGLGGRRHRWPSFSTASSGL